MRKDKSQVIALKKFIDIAKVISLSTKDQKCLQLNNFNTLLEIISGLSNSAVQRLKRLWSALPEKYMNLFSSMEELMNPQSNFRNYTSELNKRPLPTFPYFGKFHFFH
jgi:hypothetical protein